MVVFFPRPTSSAYTWDSDNDEPGSRYYYVRFESDSSSDEEEDADGQQQPPTARGRRRRRRRRIRHARLILEVSDDDDDDTDEEEDSPDDNGDDDDWDPCLHLGELPRRPMSRFHKVFIDVLFMVATAAAETVFVRTALRQVAADKDASLFIAVPLMLPVVILILFLAAFVYMLVTSDFSWRPAPAPADEKV